MPWNFLTPDRVPSLNNLPMIMQRFILGVFVTLFAIVSAGGAEPPHSPNPQTTKLLSLVSDDVTFCLTLQDLRDNVSKAGGIDTILKKIANPDDLKMIQALQDDLLKPLGITSTQLIEDLIGDSVVLAFKQGPPNKPEDEDGIFLVHARDEKLLAQLIDKINQAQKEGNELRNIHKEKGIFRRELTNGNNEYYFLHKNIFAFSDKLPLVEEALARFENPKKVNRIAQEYQKLGIGQSLVGFWLNPRAFDDDFETQLKSAKGSEKVFLKQFLAHWQAIESLGFGMDFLPHFQLSVKVRADLNRLPEKTLALLRGISEPSELWSVIPKDALFAMALRVPPQQLFAVIESFFDDKDAQKLKEEMISKLMPFLGTEDVNPLLKGTGPDHGFWLVKPEEKQSLPYAIYATRLNEGEIGREAQKMLEEAAEFAFRLASASQKGIKLKREKLAEGTTLRIMTFTEGPRGLRPAFTTKNQYFLLGSHPVVLTQFAKPKKITSDEILILRISAPAVMEYLKENGPFLSQWAEENKKGKAVDILKEIQTIVMGLDDLELIEVSVKPSGLLLSINLQLTTKAK